MKFRFVKYTRLLLAVTMISVLAGGIFMYVSTSKSQPAKASIFKPESKISDTLNLGSQPISQNRPTTIVPDEYIVKFKSQTNTSMDLNLVNSQNEKLTIKEKLDENTFLIENPNNTISDKSLGELVQAQNLNESEINLETNITTETIKQLNKSPEIESIEPNTIIRTEFAPNDPLFATQWHHQNTGQNGGTIGSDIKTTQAFDINQGNPNVIIAIIDTGVDYNHPDLTDNILRNGSNQVVGYDYENNDSDPIDDNGHGTHLAGIIAAKGNNNIGVVGVCPNCKIMPIKFMDNTGNGTTAAAISSINFAIANGAKVINLSWGSESYSNSLQGVINTAYNAGVTVVASAGNSNVTDYQFPSDMFHVISVAATDRQDKKASFSNYTDRITVSAPGVNILSTFQPGINLSGICGDASLAPSNDGYGFCTGTSMSAPLVAGVAGLILSQNPTYSADDVASTIINTSDNIDSLNPNYVGQIGSGRVNAFRALTEPLKPSFHYLESTIADPSGNNNFLAEPGENINFNVDLQNLGTSVNNVQAILSTSDPQISITQNNANYGNLAFAQNQIGLYLITLDSGVTLPKTVAFSLNISTAGHPNQIINFSHTFEKALNLPSNFDFVINSQNWTSTGLWKVSNSCFTGSNLGIPNYFHFGKDNCGDYDFNLRMIGNLYSPPFQKINPDQDATLSFDEFLETENAPNTYDKATVKIKAFGAADNTAITILNPQNNTTTWVNKKLALPSNITRAGLFQVFFSFDSMDVGNNNFKGWFVDNVSLSIDNSLNSNDILDLNLVCESAQFNGTTTCRFDLPPNKTLVPNFKIKFPNSNVSNDCILDTISTKVICNNVPTPNSVGQINIIVNLEGVDYQTNKYTQIDGVNFSTAEISFSPSEGSTSPLFLSSDPVTISINSFKNVFDLAPQNNIYECSFEFAPLGSSSDINATWTNFGSNIPYNTNSGCQSNLTKSMRGNALNLDLRLKICQISNPTTSCNTFFSQYIFRFQGAGIATGL